MRKKTVFFQEVFKSSASEVVEDYKGLKENIANNVECSLLKSQAACQYAEFQIQPKK